MNQLEYHRNNLQMDYFNDSYRKFETDFYRFSALDTPLTFLTDDINACHGKVHEAIF